MADFKQAISWMQVGKKVRRSQFPDHIFIRIHQEYFVSILDDPFKLTPSDVQSDDWEIYEEEDNWNLKEEITDCDWCAEIVTFENIQICKEKIIEDLEDIPLSCRNEKGQICISLEEAEKRIYKRFGF